MKSLSEATLKIVKHLSNTLAVTGLILMMSGCASVNQSPAPVAEKDSYLETPGNKYFNYTRSMEAKKEGDIKEAVHYLELVLKEDPESLILKRELTLLYIYENKFETALEMVKQVLKEDPEDSKSLIILGGIEQKLGHLEKAAQAYEKVIMLDPDDEKVYLVLGALYADMEMPEKTLSTYEKAVKNFPDSFYSHFFLAKAHAESGNRREAAKWFKKTLEIDRELLEPRFELLELYKDWEDQKEAHEETIKNYKEILEIDPDNTRAEMELCLYYHNSGMDKEFNAIAGELSRKSLTNPDITRKIVFLFLEKKRFDDALVILKGMLAHQPDSSDLNYLTGVVYNEIEDSEAARKYLKRVKPESKFFENAAVQIAFCYKDENKIDDAIQHLKEAMRLSPENVELHLYLGAFYEENEDYAEAENILKKALEMDAKNTGLHFRLGVVYDKWKKKDASIEQMKKVIEIDPMDAHALNYLGYTYLDLNRNMEEAEKLILRANEIKPDDGYIIDSLGWLYYKKGDVDKALEKLEKAVALVPYDPVILEHLGDVYLALGERQKAMEMFKRSLEHSKSEDNTDLEAKIKELSINGEN
jgi:tetratricopeptide (TPR) repeat protein